MLQRVESPRAEADVATSPSERLLPFAMMLVMAGGLLLSGCNTIGGMGEDVEAAGGAVSDTAEDVEESM